MDRFLCPPEAFPAGHKNEWLSPDRAGLFVLDLQAIFYISFIFSLLAARSTEAAGWLSPACLRFSPSTWASSFSVKYTGGDPPWCQLGCIPVSQQSDKKAVRVDAWMYFYVIIQ